jgi:hypothetical protein
MKPMLNVAVAVPARPVSVRTVAASMMAVAFALGAALVVPAASGMPTGIQATVAIYHHADWAQLGSRQRGIANTRNYGAPNEAVMVTAQSETTPAL